LSGAKSPPKVRVFKKVALKSRIPAFPQLKKSHPAGDKGDRGFSALKKSHPAGDKGALEEKLLYYRNSINSQLY